MKNSSKNFCIIIDDFQSKKFFIQKNSVGLIKKCDKLTSNVFFIKDKVEIPLRNDQIKIINISKTGDEYESKVCDRCFKYLPTSSFENNRRKKGDKITKRPSCEECRSIKNGIKISNADRKLWRTTKKPPDYSLFKCPICQKVSIPGIKKIVLEHNHKTGKVRGYVCESCNTGIGRFDDDIAMLKRAIKWLNQDKKSLT